MATARLSSDLGRHVLGAAALAAGVVSFVWPDYKDWDQLRDLLNATSGPAFAFCASAAQIFGGATIQFRRTARIGAIVLGVVYLVIALMYAPQIVATPLVFAPWGNSFEQFSVATGAALVYAHVSPWPRATVKTAGRIVFGICTASFGLYQALYPHGTVPLVPKWIPPSQAFWANATTFAFALAALALLVNRMALLATRLLTLMIGLFGLLVWVPALVSNPRSHSNWDEIVLNFAIAGAAWVLADLLAESAKSPRAAEA